ncbi:unnamed protein product [Mytilus coruscus]|uniref:EGF-like domain-containing protein n=1 Tax=Mytilus coruscus TaxID=42192 RepID=A0A6J8CHR8_MYTCO|nr:unnamed protein product [Mytilus coruscus]
MDGFKLYVTNTSTIPPDGYLCYEDSDPGLPNVTQTIPCYQLGKFVIYYDSKGYDIGYGTRGPFVELCYVIINGCPTYRWGSNCEEFCVENCKERNCYPNNGSCVWGCNPKNCLNDICDKETGVCTVVCKERRTGNYCDKYNMAYDGLVSQYPSGSQFAGLATDGNKFSCSKTKGHNVTFQVDLKEESIVTGLFILLGEGTTKEGLHTVYASNYSNAWNSGTVLYTGTSLPTEINFKVFFRYVTYVHPVQGPTTDLEICEIGIIGCPPTQYGPLCNTTCPKHCKGPCDLDVGHCTFGCNNGWTGNMCEEECSAGLYGKACLETCSANCLNARCNHVTGECIGGCKDGWQSFNCSQNCPNGQFGRNCSGFCDGCISRLCHHANGLCENTTSCNPGYKYSQNCIIACDYGYFSYNCANRCYCLTEPCSKGDGICSPRGCKAGWYGDSCNKEYIDGSWTRTDIVPIFKLADLAKLYSKRLEQLGVVMEGRINTTHLKNRILAAIADLQTHKQGRFVLLIFNEYVGEVLKQAIAGHVL